MPAILFVERLGNTKKVPNTPHEYECGYWVVAEETARKLVGGDLYLHDGQNQPSRFGGKILNFHVHPSGSEAGRIVFRIQATLEHRGVKTGREGWGNEKKIVW
jgi:hypothetical protein